MERLRERLAEREAAGLLRRLRPVERPGGGAVVRGGRRLLDFSSNDYLGLAHHPALAAAAREALEREGCSASASRLMSGSLGVHHELEEELARFKRREAALVLGTGYGANLGLVSALAGRRDLVLADALSHASQLDGALLSRARLLRFRHDDPEHLDFLLRRHRAEHEEALVLTESVFSMDGDLAPLAALCEVKERHGASLIVDEAHASGVFGPEGRGRVEGEGLGGRVDLVMGTFGKALGSFGAWVAGSRPSIDWLVNAARSFVFSTALPPAVAAASLAAVRLLAGGLDRGPALLARAAALREGLRSDGHRVLGESQIVPVVIGRADRTLEAAAALEAAGFLAVPVRPPTVPEGTSRLRISLSWDHAEADLVRLREALRGLA